MQFFIVNEDATFVKNVNDAVIIKITNHTDAGLDSESMTSATRSDKNNATSVVYSVYLPTVDAKLCLVNLIKKATATASLVKRVKKIFLSVSDQVYAKCTYAFVARALAVCANEVGATAYLCHLAVSDYSEIASSAKLAVGELFPKCEIKMRRAMSFLVKRDVIVKYVNNQGEVVTDYDNSRIANIAAYKDKEVKASKANKQPITPRPTQDSRTPKAACQQKGLTALKRRQALKLGDLEQQRALQVAAKSGVNHPKKKTHTYTPYQCVDLAAKSIGELESMVARVRGNIKKQSKRSTTRQAAKTAQGWIRSTLQIINEKTAERRAQLKKDMAVLNIGTIKSTFWHHVKEAMENGTPQEKSWWGRKIKDNKTHFTAYDTLQSEISGLYKQKDKFKKQLKYSAIKKNTADYDFWIHQTRSISSRIQLLQEELGECKKLCLRDYRRIKSKVEEEDVPPVRKTKEKFDQEYYDGLKGLSDLVIKDMFGEITICVKTRLEYLGTSQKNKCNRKASDYLMFRNKFDSIRDDTNYSILEDEAVAITTPAVGDSNKKAKNLKKHDTDYKIMKYFKLLADKERLAIQKPPDDYVIFKDKVRPHHVNRDRRPVLADVVAANTEDFHPLTSTVKVVNLDNMKVESYPVNNITKTIISSSKYINTHYYSQVRTFSSEVKYLSGTPILNAYNQLTSIITTSSKGNYAIVTRNNLLNSAECDIDCDLCQIEELLTYHSGRGEKSNNNTKRRNNSRKPNTKATSHKQVEAKVRASIATEELNKNMKDLSITTQKIKSNINQIKKSTAVINNNAPNTAGRRSCRQSKKADQKSTIMTIAEAPADAATAAVGVIARTINRLNPIAIILALLVLLSGCSATHNVLLKDHHITVLVESRTTLLPSPCQEDHVPMIPWEYVQNPNVRCIVNNSHYTADEQESIRNALRDINLPFCLSYDTRSRLLCANERPLRSGDLQYTNMDCNNVCSALIEPIHYAPDILQPEDDNIRSYFVKKAYAAIKNNEFSTGFDSNIKNMFQVAHDNQFYQIQADSEYNCLKEFDGDWFKYFNLNNHNCRSAIRIVPVKMLQTSEVVTKLSATTNVMVASILSFTVIVIIYAIYRPRTYRRLPLNQILLVLLIILPIALSESEECSFSTKDVATFNEFNKHYNNIKNHLEQSGYTLDSASVIRSNDKIMIEAAHKLNDHISDLNSTITEVESARLSSMLNSLTILADTHLPNCTPLKDTIYSLKNLISIIPHQQTKRATDPVATAELRDNNDALPLSNGKACYNADVTIMSEENACRKGGNIVGYGSPCKFGYLSNDAQNPCNINCFSINEIRDSIALVKTDANCLTVLMASKLFTAPNKTDIATSIKQSSITSVTFTNSYLYITTKSADHRYKLNSTEYATCCSGSLVNELGEKINHMDGLCACKEYSPVPDIVNSYESFIKWVEEFINKYYRKMEENKASTWVLVFLIVALIRPKLIVLLLVILWVTKVVSGSDCMVNDFVLTHHKLNDKDVANSAIADLSEGDCVVVGSSTVKVKSIKTVSTYRLHAVLPTQQTQLCSDTDWGCGAGLAGEVCQFSKGNKPCHQKCKALTTPHRYKSYCSVQPSFYGDSCFDILTPEPTVFGGVCLTNPLNTAYKYYTSVHGYDHSEATLIIYQGKTTNTIVISDNKLVARAGDTEIADTKFYKNRKPINVLMTPKPLCSYSFVEISQYLYSTDPMMFQFNNEGTNTESWSWFPSNKSYSYRIGNNLISNIQDSTWEQCDKYEISAKPEYLQLTTRESSFSSKIYSKHPLVLDNHKLCSKNPVVKISSNHVRVERLDHSLITLVTNTTSNCSLFVTSDDCHFLSDTWCHITPSSNVTCMMNAYCPLSYTPSVSVHYANNSKNMSFIAGIHTTISGDYLWTLYYNTIDNINDHFIANKVIQSLFRFDWVITHGWKSWIVTGACLLLAFSFLAQRAYLISVVFILIGMSYSYVLGADGQNNTSDVDVIVLTISILVIFSIFKVNKFIIKSFLYLNQYIIQTWEDYHFDDFILFNNLYNLTTTVMLSTVFVPYSLIILIATQFKNIISDWLLVQNFPNSTFFTEELNWQMPFSRKIYNYLRTTRTNADKGVKPNQNRDSDKQLKTYLQVLWEQHPELINYHAPKKRIGHALSAKSIEYMFGEYDNGGAEGHFNFTKNKSGLNSILIKNEESLNDYLTDNLTRRGMNTHQAKISVEGEFIGAISATHTRPRHHGLIMKGTTLNLAPDVVGLNPRRLCHAKNLPDAPFSLRCTLSRDLSKNEKFKYANCFAFHDAPSKATYILTKHNLLSGSVVTNSDKAFGIISRSVSIDSSPLGWIFCYEIPDMGEPFEVMKDNTFGKKYLSIVYNLLNQSPVKCRSFKKHTRHTLEDSSYPDQDLYDELDYSVDPVEQVAEYNNISPDALRNLDPYDQQELAEKFLQYVSNNPDLITLQQHTASHYISQEQWYCGDEVSDVEERLSEIAYMYMSDYELSEIDYEPPKQVEKIVSVAPSPPVTLETILEEGAKLQESSKLQYPLSIQPGKHTNTKPEIPENLKTYDKTKQVMIKQEEIPQIKASIIPSSLVKGTKQYQKFHQKRMHNEIKDKNLSDDQFMEYINSNSDYSECYSNQFKQRIDRITRERHQPNIKVPEYPSEQPTPTIVKENLIAELPYKDKVEIEKLFKDDNPRPVTFVNEFHANTLGDDGWETYIYDDQIVLVHSQVLRIMKENPLLILLGSKLKQKIIEPIGTVDNIAKYFYSTPYDEKGPISVGTQTKRKAMYLWITHMLNTLNKKSKSLHEVIRYTKTMLNANNCTSILKFTELLIEDLIQNTIFYKMPEQAHQQFITSLIKISNSVPGSDLLPEYKLYLPLLTFPHTYENQLLCHKWNYTFMSLIAPEVNNIAQTEYEEAQNYMTSYSDHYGPHTICYDTDRCSVCSDFKKFKNGETYLVKINDTLKNWISKKPTSLYPTPPIGDLWKNKNDYTCYNFTNYEKIKEAFGSEEKVRNIITENILSSGSMTPERDYWRDQQKNYDMWRKNMEAHWGKHFDYTVNQIQYAVRIPPFVLRTIISFKKTTNIKPGIVCYPQMVSKQGTKLAVFCASNIQYIERARNLRLAAAWLLQQGWPSIDVDVTESGLDMQTITHALTFPMYMFGNHNIAIVRRDGYTPDFDNDHYFRNPTTDYSPSWLFTTSNYWDQFTFSANITRMSLAVWKNLEPVGAQEVYCDIPQFASDCPDILATDPHTFPEFFNDNAFCGYTLSSGLNSGSAFSVGPSLVTSHHVTKGNPIHMYHTLPATYPCEKSGIGNFIFKRINSDIVGDMDMYVSPAQFSRPRLGELYCAVSLTLGWVRWMVCTAVSSKYEGRENASFDEFTPVNVDWDTNTIKTQEYISFAGMSGSPIVSSKNEIVGIYGLLNTSTKHCIIENTTVKATRNYSVVKTSDVDIKSFFKSAAQEIIHWNTERSGKTKAHLVAATGTGKSTILPVQLLISLHNANVRSHKIALLQPMAAAVNGCYNRIIENLNQIDKSWREKYTVQRVLGSVGRTAEESFECEGTGGLFLQVATYGRFLAGMRLDTNNPHGFNLLLLDEIHTTATDDDVAAINLLKDIASDRKTKKVLMTATAIDALTDYPINNGQELNFCRFNIEEQLLNEEIKDPGYVNTFTIDTKAAKVNLKTHQYITINWEDINTGRTLIFVPSRRDTEKLVMWCKQTYPSHLETFVALHAGSKPDTVDKLPEHAIIFCTDYASVSITVPNCRCVVDFQMDYTPHVSLKRSMDGITYSSKLVLSDVSKQVATQRKGRTGRTCNGIYIYPGARHLTNVTEIDPDRFPCIYFNILIKNNKVDNLHSLLEDSVFKEKVLDNDWLRPGKLTDYLMEVYQNRYGRIVPPNLSEYLYGLCDRLDAVKTWNNDQLWSYLTPSVTDKWLHAALDPSLVGLNYIGKHGPQMENIIRNRWVVKQTNEESQLYNEECMVEVYSYREDLGDADNIIKKISQAGIKKTSAQIRQLYSKYASMSAIDALKELEHLEGQSTEKLESALLFGTGVAVVGFGAVVGCMFSLADHKLWRIVQECQSCRIEDVSAVVKQKSLNFSINEHKLRQITFLKRIIDTVKNFIIKYYKKIKGSLKSVLDFLFKFTRKVDINVNNTETQESAESIFLVWTGKMQAWFNTVGVHMLPTALHGVSGVVLGLNYNQLCHAVGPTVAWFLVIFFNTVVATVGMAPCVVTTGAIFGSYLINTVYRSWGSIYPKNYGSRTVILASGLALSCWFGRTLIPAIASSGSCSYTAATGSSALASLVNPQISGSGSTANGILIVKMVYNLCRGSKCTSWDTGAQGITLGYLLLTTNAVTSATAVAIGAAIASFRALFRQSEWWKKAFVSLNIKSESALKILNLDSTLAQGGSDALDAMIENSLAVAGILANPFSLISVVANTVVTLLQYHIREVNSSEYTIGGVVYENFLNQSGIPAVFGVATAMGRLASEYWTAINNSEKQESLLVVALVSSVMANALGFAYYVRGLLTNHWQENEVSESIKSVFNTMWEFAKKILNYIKQFFKNSYNSVKRLFVAEVTDTIQSIGSEVITQSTPYIASDVASAIASTSETVANTVSSITERASSIVSSVSDSINSSIFLDAEDIGIDCDATIVESSSHSSSRESLATNSSDDYHLTTPRSYLLKVKTINSDCAQLSNILCCEKTYDSNERCGDFPNNNFIKGVYGKDGKNTSAKSYNLLCSLISDLPYELICQTPEQMVRALSLVGLADLSTDGKSAIFHLRVEAYGQSVRITFTPSWTNHYAMLTMSLDTYKKDTLERKMTIGTIYQLISRTATGMQGILIGDGIVGTIWPSLQKQLLQLISIFNRMDIAPTEYDNAMAYANLWFDGFIAHSRKKEEISTMGQFKKDFIRIRLKAQKSSWLSNQANVFKDKTMCYIVAGSLKAFSKNFINLRGPSDLAQKKLTITWDNFYPNVVAYLRCLRSEISTDKTLFPSFIQERWVKIDTQQLDLLCPPDRIDTGDSYVYENSVHIYVSKPKKATPLDPQLYHPNEYLLTEVEFANRSFARTNFAALSYYGMFNVVTVDTKSGITSVCLTSGVCNCTLDIRYLADGRAVITKKICKNTEFCSENLQGVTLSSNKHEFLEYNMKKKNSNWLVECLSFESGAVSDFKEISEKTKQWCSDQLRDLTSYISSYNLDEDDIFYECEETLESNEIFKLTTETSDQKLEKLKGRAERSKDNSYIKKLERDQFQGTADPTPITIADKLHRNQQILKVRDEDMFWKYVSEQVQYIGKLTTPDKIEDPTLLSHAAIKEIHDQYSLYTIDELIELRDNIIDQSKEQPEDNNLSKALRDIDLYIKTQHNKVSYSSAPWLTGFETVEIQKPTHSTWLTDGNMHLYKPASVSHEIVIKQIKSHNNYVQKLSRKYWETCRYTNRMELPSQQESVGKLFASRAACKAQLLYEFDPPFFKDCQTLFEPACGFGGFPQFFTHQFKELNPRKFFFSTLTHKSAATPNYNVMECRESNCKLVRCLEHIHQGNLCDPKVVEAAQEVVKTNSVDILLFDMGETFTDPEREFDWLFDIRSLKDDGTQRLQPILKSMYEIIKSLKQGGKACIKINSFNSKLSIVIHTLTKHFRKIKGHKLATTPEGSREHYLFCDNFDINWTSPHSRTKLYVESLAELVHSSIIISEQIYRSRGRHFPKPLQHTWFKPKSSGTYYTTLPSLNLNRIVKKQDGSTSTTETVALPPGHKLDFTVETDFGKWHLNNTWDPNWNARLTHMRWFTRWINQEAKERRLSQGLSAAGRNIIFEDIIRSDFQYVTPVGSFKCKAQKTHIKHTKNDLISSYLSSVAGMTVRNCTYGHTQATPEYVKPAQKRRLDCNPGDPMPKQVYDFAKAVELLLTNNGRSHLGKMRFLTKEEVLVAMNNKGSTGILDPGHNLLNFTELFPEWYEMCWEHLFNKYVTNQATHTYFSVRTKPEPKERKDVDDGRLQYDKQTVTIDQLDEGSNLSPRFIQFADSLSRLSHYIAFGYLIQQHGHQKLYKGSINGTPPHIQGRVIRTYWDLHNPTQKRIIHNGNNPNVDLRLNLKKQKLQTETKICITNANYDRLCYDHVDSDTTTQNYQDNLPAGITVDFSALDSTITTSERMTMCEMWKRFFKSDTEKQIIDGICREMNYAICLNDDGDIWVRSGQRGSGELLTSIENTYIVAANMACSTAHALGISLEQLLTTRGTVSILTKNDNTGQHKIQVDSTVADQIAHGAPSKTFEFGSICFLIDGDDVLILTTRRKAQIIKNYLNTKQNWLTFNRKSIRSGNKAGCTLYTNFEELSFCSHFYEPVYVGTGASNYVPKDTVTIGPMGDSHNEILHTAQQNNFKIFFLPHRKIANILSKLMVTLKMVATKWDPTDESIGGTVDVTQSKLLSYLLLYPQIRWVRYTTLSILCVTGDHLASFQELKKRYPDIQDIKMTTGSKFLSALYSLYGVISLDDISLRDYKTDFREITVVNYNVKLTGNTCARTKNMYLKKSFDWLHSQQKFDIFPLTWDTSVFKKYQAYNPSATVPLSEDIALSQLNTYIRNKNKKYNLLNYLLSFF